MKKLISLGVLAVVVAVFGLVRSPSVIAETTPTQAQCTLAQTRLTTRTANVEKTYAAQTKVYNALQTRLGTLVSSAKETGYDTTALVAAQEAFTAKMTTYADKAVAYSTAITAISDTVCGTRNTEFIKSVTDARAALIAVRTASLDVRITFRTQVVPELKNYATSLKVDNQTGGTN